jgi:hypothetical protein
MAYVVLVTLGFVGWEFWRFFTAPKEPIAPPED